MAAALGSRSSGEVRRSAASPRGALAALALAMLLASLGTSIVNIALPTLARTFGASVQQVQWIVLAYLLTTTALVVGAGRLGDIVGRRRLLSAGILLFTAASLLCAAAGPLWLLIAARALQGAGAAVMIPLSTSLALDSADGRRSGRAMGLLGSMSAVGTALGPALGGVLIESFGWRSIFLANLPFGIAALLLAGRCLPADRAAPAREARSFDVIGTCLLALTLGAFALAMTVGRGRFGCVNLALLAAAAMGAGVFAAVQRGAASPLVRLALLREPRLGTGLAASTLVAAVMMATLIAGPFYLSRAVGLDAAAVGGVMAVGPVVAALAGVPAGRIVDRFGPGRAVTAGLVGIFLGCSMLALVPLAFGTAGYIVPIAAVTAGYALFQTANNIAVVGSAAAAERGVASGLLNLSRNLGLIAGASVLGALFAAAAEPLHAAGSPAESIAHGLHETFAASLVLIALALACVHTGSGRALRTRRTPGRTGKAAI